MIVTIHGVKETKWKVNTWLQKAQNEILELRKKHKKETKADTDKCNLKGDCKGVN